MLLTTCCQEPRRRRVGNPDVVCCTTTATCEKRADGQNASSQHGLSAERLSGALELTTCLRGGTRCHRSQTPTNRDDGQG